jgi:hypothetical protein
MGKNSVFCGNRIGIVWLTSSRVSWPTRVCIGHGKGGGSANWLLSDEKGQSSDVASSVG